MSDLYDDPDLLKKMTNMGMFSYSAEEIVNILDIEDVDKFVSEFKNPKSAISKAYAQGKDKFMLTVDQALVSAAKKGSLEALRELEHRIKKREAK